MDNHQSSASSATSPTSSVNEHPLFKNSKIFTKDIMIATAGHLPMGPIPEQARVGVNGSKKREVGTKNLPVRNGYEKQIVVVK